MCAWNVGDEDSHDETETAPDDEVLQEISQNRDDQEKLEDRRPVEEGQDLGYPIAC